MNNKLKKLVKNKKVIIFDFDNTMASTEKYSWMAYADVLKAHGVLFLKKHIHNYIGKPDKIIIPSMEKDYNVILPYQETLKQKVEKHLAYTLEDNVNPYPFVEELLKTFPEKFFYIMSSNTIQIINPLLKKWNMDKKFQEIYTYQESQISKKERLENCLQNFSAPIHEVVLFEDSPSTINMAKKLGVTCVFIENSLNKGSNCLYDYKLTPDKK